MPQNDLLRSQCRGREFDSPPLHWFPTNLDSRSESTAFGAVNVICSSILQDLFATSGYRNLFEPISSEELDTCRWSAVRLRRFL